MTPPLSARTTRASHLQGTTKLKIHGLDRADSPSPRHAKPRWQVGYRDQSGHERSAGIFTVPKAAETIRKRVERGLPATLEDGEKKVLWRFGDQQIANLQPPGSTAPVVGRVVVLAIPCLSENVPAELGTAAMATYAIASDGMLLPVSDPGSWRARRCTRSGWQGQPASRQPPA